MPDRSPATTFADRHLGPRPEDVERMLAALGVATLDELIDQAVPKTIRTRPAAAAPRTPAPSPRCWPRCGSWRAATRWSRRSSAPATPAPTPPA